MWNPMGLVVSMILVAAGAILIWAVTADVSGVSIDAIGWILLVVGIVSFLLTLVLWSPWTTRTASREYVEEAPVRRRRARAPRERVVEEREVAYEDDVPRGPPPP